MLRYPPWCGKQMTIEQRKTKVEDGKDLRWTMEDREREKEVKENRRKVEDMVPKRFHKWLKVFGKQESERMPVRKTWNHAIDLQEEFVPRKGRIYLLCYDSELLTRSNCDRNSRQPCILSSPPVRGSG